MREVTHCRLEGWVIWKSVWLLLRLCWTLRLSVFKLDLSAHDSPRYCDYFLGGLSWPTPEAHIWSSSGIWSICSTLELGHVWFPGQYLTTDVSYSFIHHRLHALSLTPCQLHHIGCLWWYLRRVPRAAESFRFILGRSPAVRQLSASRHESGMQCCTTRW